MMNYDQCIWGQNSWPHLGAAQFVGQSQYTYLGWAWALDTNPGHRYGVSNRIIQVTYERERERERERVSVSLYAVLSLQNMFLILPEAL
jgi:hypothetical protein